MTGKINLREGQVWESVGGVQLTVVKRSGMRAVLEDEHGQRYSMKYKTLRRLYKLIKD